MKRSHNAGESRVHAKTAVYVIENPGSVGTGNGAGPGPYVTRRADTSAWYWEFPRKEDLTWNPSAAAFCYFPTPIYAGMPSPSLDPGVTTQMPWFFRNNTRVGIPNQFNAAYADIYHDGIAVGCAGTFCWTFNFGTGMLPGEFYQDSMQYGSCRFLKVQCEIYPRNTRPWAAGPSGVLYQPVAGVFGSVDPFTQVPEAAATVVAGGALVALAQSNPALTHFHVDAVKIPWSPSLFPLPAERHSALFLASTYLDAVNKPSLVEVAMRNGGYRVDMGKPLKFTHRFMRGVWADVDPYNIPFPSLNAGGNITGVQAAWAQETGTGTGYVLIPKYLTRKTRRLSSIRVPLGGWIPPGVPVNPSNPLRSQAPIMEEYSVPLGSLLIDSNCWTSEYVDRSRTTTTHVPPFQDFTVGVETQSYNPALMNPPLEWVVRYTVWVHWSAKNDASRVALYGQ